MTNRKELEIELQTLQHCRDQTNLVGRRHPHVVNQVRRSIGRSGIN